MSAIAASVLRPARARGLTVIWINRVRSRHQLGAPLADLPAGWGGSSGCPIAGALSDLEAGRCAEVGLRYARIHSAGTSALDDIRLQLPTAAQAFIGWFDELAYPDLLRHL